MRNHDDEYSFHFLLQWDDGQELQQSLDGQYKMDVPWQEIWLQNPDADSIMLEGICKNYPLKAEKIIEALSKK